MLAEALLVFAQATVTASGARPAECAPLAAAAASNVWERAKYPALRRYCDLLSSGAAKLASGGSGAAGVGDPAREAREAIANADEAQKALPGHAAPGVLRGRALVSLGQFAEAVAAMEAASAADPHALDEPAALFAWGRALGRTGRLADAEGAFRSLLPRASALPPAERGKAELEAGLLAQARGSAGLDQAIALFRLAHRDAQDAIQVVAGMALALALDRGGEREESRVPEIGRHDPREIVKDASVREALADSSAPAEEDALVGFALAERDPATAREAWGRYLAGKGATGPWAEHARATARGGVHGGKSR